MAQAAVAAAEASVQDHHPDPVKREAGFGEAFADAGGAFAGETSARVLSVLPGGEVQQGNVLCALHPRFKCRVKTGPRYIYIYIYIFIYMYFSHHFCC